MDEARSQYDIYSDDIFYLWTKSMLLFMDDDLEKDRYWDAFKNRSEGINFNYISNDIEGLMNPGEKVEARWNSLKSFVDSFSEEKYIGLDHDPLRLFLILREYEDRPFQVFNKYLSESLGKNNNFQFYTLMSKMLTAVEMNNFESFYFNYFFKNPSDNKNLNNKEFIKKWKNKLKRQQKDYGLVGLSDKNIKLEKIFTREVNKDKYILDKQLKNIHMRYFVNKNSLIDVTINLDSKPDSLERDDFRDNTKVKLEYWNNHYQSLGIMSLNDKNYATSEQLFPNNNLTGKYYESEDYMEYYLYGGGKYLFIPRTEKDIDEYRRSIIDTEGIGGLDYLLSPLTIAIFISLLTVL
jgi:hypothetical protein